MAPHRAPRALCVFAAVLAASAVHPEPQPQPRSRAVACNATAVVPVPQRCTRAADGATLAVDGSYVVAANLTDGPSAFAAAQLRQSLAQPPASLRLELVDTASLGADSTKFIAIGGIRTDAALLRLAAQRGAAPAPGDLDHGEGYTLSVLPGAKAVLGKFVN